MTGEAPWEKDPVVNVGGSAKEPWSNDPVVFDPNDTGSPITNAWSDSAKEIRHQQNDNPMLDKRLERRARLQGAGEAPNFARNGPASSFNEKGSLAPGAPVSNDFKDGPGAAGTWGLETAYTIGAAPLIEAGNAGYDALTGRGSFGDRYSHYQKKFDTLRDIGNEDHPWAGWAGTGTGIAGAFLAPELSVANWGRVGNAALNGAVYGGLFGVGNPGSWGEAGRNMALGSVLGGAMGAGMGKAFDTLASRRAARLAERGMGDEYASRLGPVADELGLEVRPYEKTGDIRGYSNADLAINEGLGPGAHRVATAAVQRRPGNIQGAIDTLNDQIAGGHVAYSNPTEAASALQHSVRNTVEGDTAGMAQGLGRMGDELGGGQRLVQNRTDVGDVVGTAVRDRAAQAKQGYQSAYESAAAKEGEFAKEGLSPLASKVRMAMDEGPGGPVPINEATPRTAEALNFLDSVSAMKGPASATGVPADASGITLQGMERVRQRLLALARQAKAARNGPNGATDYYGMNRLINAYEDHIDSMIQEGMYRGDPEAIPAWQQARAARRQYAEMYTPRDRSGKLTDAGRALMDIIENDRRPEDVARYVLGATRVGDSNQAVQMVTQLRNILGANSQEFAAIKQGVWNELTKLENAADVSHKEAVKIADRIDEMLSNRGRSFANALFNENERAALKSVSSGLRSISARGGSPKAIKQLTDIASRDLRPEDVAKMVTGGDAALGSKETLPVLRAIKSVYGEQSAQWSAVRQTIFRQLVSNGSEMGPQKLHTRITNFLAKNRTIAGEVFSEKELAKLRAFNDILGRMVPPPGAVNRSNTFNKAMGALGKAASSLGSMLGFMQGDFTGMGLGWLAGKGFEMTKSAAGKSTAEQLFNGKNALGVTRAARAAGRGIEHIGRGAATVARRPAGPAVGRLGQDFGRFINGAGSSAAADYENDQPD